MKTPKELDFIQLSEISRTQFRMDISFRHRSWFKFCFKAWLDHAKDNYRNPIFWIYLTPRYIIRLIKLAHEQN